MIDVLAYENQIYYQLGLDFELAIRNNDCIFDIGTSCCLLLYLTAYYASTTTVKIWCTWSFNLYLFRFVTPLSQVKGKVGGSQACLTQLQTYCEFFKPETCCPMDHMVFMFNYCFFFYIVSLFCGCLYRHIFIFLPFTACFYVWVLVYYWRTYCSLKMLVYYTFWMAVSKSIIPHLLKKYLLSNIHNIRILM